MIVKASKRSVPIDRDPFGRSLPHDLVETNLIVKWVVQEMDQIQGFVLTGGASSRMGRDKAQMEVGGKMLYERSAIALAEVCAEKIFLVGRNAADLAAKTELAVNSIPDRHAERAAMPAASIVGLYSALANAKTKWIAVLACDLPFVRGQLISKLAEHRSEKFDAIVPLQEDATPQPLCALYRRERCLPVAEEMLLVGEFQLRKFLSRVTTHYVDNDKIARLEGSTEFFLNVNDHAEYEAALKILKRG